MKEDNKIQGYRKEDSLTVYMLEGCVWFYLIGMIGIFPLFFNQWYLDITRTKKAFFENVTEIFLVLCLILAVAALIGRLSYGKFSIKGTWTDIFALIFFLTVVVSCWMSPVGKEALVGEKHRGLGGLFLILCVGAYFVLSRFYQTSKVLIWTFFIANFIMCFWIVAQFFGIDLFSMYQNLVERQHTIFMGTLGNINTNAGYLGVMVSIVSAYYVTAKNSREKIASFLLMVVGIYACYAIRSDSWILAVSVAYFVLLWLSLKEEKMLIAWWQVCFAFWLSSLLMKITVEVVAFAGGNVWVSDFQKQNIMSLLTGTPVLILEALFLMVTYFFRKYLKNASWIKKHGGKCMVFFTILLLLAAVFYVYPLEDSFGNNRGYIWKRSLSVFARYPLPQKLFGYGPNCFLQAIDPIYGEEMRQLYGDPFVDAHNESLQFLLVTGIFGVVSYLGIQISLLISFLRKKTKEPARIIAILGLTAYLAQGLVNNPQVYTTPLLFLLLGMLQKKYLEETP